MQEHSFYFASTPLHLLLFSAFCIDKPEKAHHLLLIDQKITENNVYFEAARAWQSSPFKSLHLFGGQTKKGAEKIAHRKEIFSEIQKLIDQYNPNELLTGSDKRLEFQFAASLLPKAKSMYVDEGTFTYIPPSSLKQLSNRFIDTPFKKLTYGSWIKSTPFTGGSDYIDKVIAAFPDQVHHQLREKTIKSFPKENIFHPAISELSKQLINQSHFNLEQLKSLTYLFILPHESILDTPLWQQLFSNLNKKGIAFGVKYHPRSSAPDPLNLQSLTQAIILPKILFFEALLPALPPETHLISDLSSVLLTTRWLRDDIKTTAVIDKVSKKHKAFINFYERIGVECTNSRVIAGRL